MTISELYARFDRDVAPFSLQEAWDNSGLLAGDPAREITACLICLDITPGVVEEALAKGANLLISHHPVILEPVCGVLADSVVYRLIRAGLAAICAHTNLDAAAGGVNDCLARALGLRDIGPLRELENNPGFSLGRVGTLEAPLQPDAFAARAALSLGAAGGVRYTAGSRAVRRVAVCGGSGGPLLPSVRKARADAFVTGELKHHILLECAALGLTAVDAGHFETESVVLSPLAVRLAELCPGVTFLVSRQGPPARRA